MFYLFLKEKESKMDNVFQPGSDDPLLADAAFQEYLDDLKQAPAPALANFLSANMPTEEDFDEYVLFA